MSEPSLSLREQERERILGQLLFLTNVILVLPTPEKIGEVVVAALERLATVKKVVFCLGNEGPPVEDREDVCSACTRSIVSENGSYHCNLDGGEEYRLFSMRSSDTFFGYLLVSFRSGFDLTPFLTNLANTIATILEKARIRRELERTIQTLNKAQQVAHFGHWEMDHKKGVLHCSDEVFCIFGLSPNSFTPTYSHFLEFLHPEDRVVVDEAFGMSIQKREPHSLIHRVVRPDGGLRYVFHQWVHETDAEGNVLQTLGIIHDVTERIEAESELDQYRSHLEQRVKEEIGHRKEQEKLLIQQTKLAAMGEMIGMIAHQWRQPLNTLALQVQDFQEAYRCGELTDAYVDQTTEVSLKVIQRMSETIDDFRNFFQQDRKRKSFFTKDAVLDALNIIGPSLENNGIRVIRKNGEGVQVTGYPNEYAQVVLNLLDNCKDALKSRKIPEKWIEIECDRSEDGRSRLRIADNGGGIPVEILQRIFEPYFTTKPASQGTGIGLYMSKMIIERHMNGSIIAENYGDGARLTILV